MGLPGSAKQRATRCKILKSKWINADHVEENTVTEF